MLHRGQLAPDGDRAQSPLPLARQRARIPPPPLCEAWGTLRRLGELTLASLAASLSPPSFPSRTKPVAVAATCAYFSRGFSTEAVNMPTETRA